MNLGADRRWAGGEGQPQAPGVTGLKSCFCLFLSEARLLKGARD